MANKKNSKRKDNKLDASRVSAQSTKSKAPKTQLKAPNAKAQEELSKQSAPKQATNQWRNEPGVSEPLRVGRAMRTRDNNFKGQKNKSIHPEQPTDELYRRIAVVDIDDDSNVAVVQIKRKNAKNVKAVPQDKQERKYIPDLLTLDSDSRPIKQRRGKFELAPTSEDITEKQAKMILSDIENGSKAQKQRMTLFRRNKKRRG